MGDNNSYPNELHGQPGYYDDKRKLKQAYLNKTLQKQQLCSQKLPQQSWCILVGMIRNC